MSGMPEGKAQLQDSEVPVLTCDGEPDDESSGRLEMNACLPGCVWNATPRALSPLERNIGFWTQA